VESGSETNKELIRLVRSSIVRLALFNKDREQIGSATGFLSNDFLVTCSQVIRKEPFDAVEFTFGDQSLREITPIRLSADTLIGRLARESPESECDYAVIRFSEPETRGRYQLEVRSPRQESVGEQVLFFGFPFGTQNLTSHVGYISSDFRRGGVHRFQIDGSINPGNSGGPLIHIPSGSVIGMVTRAETGLEKDFDEVIEAIQNTVEAMKSGEDQAFGGARVTIGEADLGDSLLETMRILKKLSLNMKRGANVGIGFCVSSEHIIQTGLIKESK
jgi:hypothetical protein